MNGTLIFFYNFFEEVKFEFPSLNCGKDGKHGEAGHRREQSDWGILQHQYPTIRMAVV